MSSEDDGLSGPRWELTEEISDAVRRRWAADVLAVGVQGSLAHGDDTTGSDIDLVVVTYQPGRGPRPGSRRIDGIIVDLGVISADEYLQHARTLSTSWPLAADQYLSTRPLYDPDNWLDQLRDTHLARLAEAPGGEFAALARAGWYEAASVLARAGRLASWYDTDGAVLLLAQARIALATVEGLLTRTYFRGPADAVRRTGLGDSNRAELGEKLDAQAVELDKRGRPVDGDVTDLLS
ncbi:nucleotidyltransferase domain-containing protein [Longispora albida]|uniref:nucleotidyltransferase domain-containing protein n=1 Tax=Longispora albida TaxID=203523 RepID=UPI000379CB94|nr:nucleotidyltransferase domain-containing protein [Longispora albida]